MSVEKGRPERLTNPPGGSERVSPMGRPEGEHPSAKHEHGQSERGGMFHPAGSPARQSISDSSHAAPRSRSTMIACMRASTTAIE